MSCPTCLVGFAGFGDASSVFAPVRADIPLAGQPLSGPKRVSYDGGRTWHYAVSGLGDVPDQVRVLAAFGVGALVGFVVLRTVLPAVGDG